MNKSHAVFRVDVNDDKPSQDLQVGCHLISLPRLFKQTRCLLNQTLLLSVLFQQFTTGVRLVTRCQNDYLIDNYVGPAVI